ERLALNGCIARVTIEFAAHFSGPAHYYLTCADFHQSSKLTSENLTEAQIVVVTAQIITALRPLPNDRHLRSRNADARLIKFVVISVHSIRLRSISSTPCE